MANGINIAMNQQNKSRTAGAKDKKKRKQKQGTTTIGHATYDNSTGAEILPEGFQSKFPMTTEYVGKKFAKLGSEVNEKSRTAGARDKKKRKIRDSGSVWDHPSAQTKVQKEIVEGYKQAMSKWNVENPPGASSVITHINGKPIKQTFKGGPLDLVDINEKNYKIMVERARTMNQEGPVNALPGEPNE